MRHVATGVGSMPGESFDEAMKAVFGELDDLPFLVELPARGPYAGMIARTAAMISDLGVDLQPSGWRLTDASGLDHRRAASLLAHDLDLVAALGEGLASRFKTQVTGPWTLAASMELPRGGRVLGDHGARRELAQALVEGVARHLADVRRRVPGARVVVQIDEPSLPAVLSGGIATPSGLDRYRTVTPLNAVESLEWLIKAIRSSEAEVVVHCCAAEVPFNVFSETSTDAVSFNLDAVSSDLYDSLGEWVDGGRSLWPGLVPSLEPSDSIPSSSDLTKRLLSWWAEIGYSDVEALPDTTITPTCGLAGASPSWARTALELARTVARNASVEAGKIEP